MNKQITFILTLCFSCVSISSAAPNRNAAGVLLELTSAPAAAHDEQYNEANLRLELINTSQPAPEGAITHNTYLFLGVFGNVVKNLTLPLTHQRLAAYLLGIITLSERELRMADPNNDGTIDIADVISLLLLTHAP